MHLFPFALTALIALSTAGCAAPASPGTVGCADVVSVEVSASPDGTYRFDVTVASDDTGWGKYADAWEVRTLAGVVVGKRQLAHPHVDEQPFTRSLSGVRVPSETLIVAARDSVEGFCGDTLTIHIPEATGG